MLNNISEIKLQNISFNGNKKGNVYYLPGLKEDSFERSIPDRSKSVTSKSDIPKLVFSKNIKLSRNGEQVKTLLFKLQSFRYQLGSKNPSGFFLGEVEDLAGKLGKEEFYRAFLEVAQNYKQIPKKDILPGEIGRASIKVHKDNTKGVFDRHVNWATKHFTDAMVLVDKYVKNNFPEEIRRSLLIKENITKNVKNLVEETSTNIRNIENQQLIENLTEEMKQEYDWLIQVLRSKRDVLNKIIKLR